MNQSSAMGAVGNRNGGVGLHKADGAQMISTVTLDVDKNLQDLVITLLDCGFAFGSLSLLYSQFSILEWKCLLYVIVY